MTAKSVTPFPVLTPLRRFNISYESNILQPNTKGRQNEEENGRKMQLHSKLGQKS